MGSLRSLNVNHTAREQKTPPRRNRKSPNSYSVKWHLVAKKRLKEDLKQKFPDIAFRMFARSDRIRRTVDYLSPKYRWIEVRWIVNRPTAERRRIYDEVERGIKEVCRTLNYDSRDFNIAVGEKWINVQEKFSWDL